jgi:hypothetical protein
MTEVFSIGFELGSDEYVPTPALHNHFSIYVECVAASQDP